MLAGKGAWAGAVRLLQCLLPWLLAHGTSESGALVLEIPATGLADMGEMQAVTESCKFLLIEFKNW